MITKNMIAKFVVAVALTIVMITSSGVAAEQLGFDVMQSVYAGDCSSGAGGGC